jgi:hypothetical protein
MPPASRGLSKINAQVRPRMHAKKITGWLAGMRAITDQTSHAFLPCDRTYEWYDQHNRAFDFVLHILIFS